MKKTLKILVSVFLAAVIAFGSFSSAFAAEVKKIEWVDEYGDSMTYYYTELEVSEGSNTVTTLDALTDFPYPDEETGELTIPYGYDYYYDFTAEKTGYYSFISAQNIAAFGVAKKFDGNKATGYCEMIYYGENTNSVIYIEKGKTIVGVHFPITNSIYTADSLNIEYLGDELTDYTVDSANLDDFVIGKNIWEEKTGDFGIGTNCTMKFRNGSEFVMSDVYLYGTCGKTPKAGKNTATLELFGKKKTIEFTAAYLKDIVSSVEVSDIDKYTSFVVDYTGETRYEAINNGDVTLKFKNGTSATVTLNEGQGEVELSNGVVAPVYAGLSMNADGSYDFVVTVWDDVFKKVKVDEKEGTFADNISYLTTDNFEALSRAGDDFITAFSFIFSDPEFASISFGLIGDDLLSIFTNMIAFISHCFAF